MDRWIALSRLGLVLVVLSHGLVLAGCKAKCRPGQRLEGKICIRIGAEGPQGDAGLDAQVASAEAGADGGSATIASMTSSQNAAVEDAGADAASDDQSAHEASSGGAAGAAAGSAGMGETMPSEPCDSEGTTRCAPSGAQGSRETCKGMVWTPGTPCADAETCVMENDSAECAAVEQLCVGSQGQPVCDLQGTMLLCNEDGTLRSQEMCGSAELCQAGLVAGVCAACLAAKESRCTDKTLEVCADDGMTFTMQQECETAALCNPTVGMCTDATCAPDAFSCEDNTLKVCNEDGTGFDESRSRPCGSGTCDATGMDCNMCVPGMKMCMGDSPAVCEETGQKFEPMPCSDGMHCAGSGNCVQCDNHGHCPDAANGCQEGRCRGTACTTTSAPDGKS